MMKLSCLAILYERAVKSGLFVVLITLLVPACNQSSNTGDCPSNFLSALSGRFSQLALANASETCRLGQLVFGTGAYHYEIDLSVPSMDIFLYRSSGCTTDSDLKISIVLNQLAPRTLIDGNTCTIEGTIQSIRVTPLSQFQANQMIQNNFCQRNNWSVNQTLEFESGCTEISSAALKNGVILRDILRRQTNAILLGPKTGFGFFIGDQNAPRSLDDNPYTSL